MNLQQDQKTTWASHSVLKTTTARALKCILKEGCCVVTVLSLLGNLSINVGWFSVKQVSWTMYPLWIKKKKPFFQSFGGVAHQVISDSLPPHGLQHARLPCPSLSPGVCSGPLSQWCYLAISSNATPLSFCFQSFPALGSFPMSQFLESGGQSMELWWVKHK